MKWRSKESPAEVEQVLADIISRASVDGGTLNYAFEDYGTVRTGFSVIITAFTPRSDIPDHAYEDFISHAIRQIIESNSPATAETLRGAVTAAERSYLKRKPTQYTLLSRVSIALPPGQHRKIRWMGHDLRFSVTQPRGFVRPAPAIELEEKQRRVDTYCWVRIPISARDEVAAGNRASEILDEWRAVWNYALNYNKRRISFNSGHPFPINVVVAGPVHTLHHRDGSPATSVHWWEPAHLEGIRISDIGRDLDRVKQLTRKYQRNIRSSAAGTAVSKLMVRYARALDERDMHSGFLKLWGVLEVATNTTFQSYEVTVKRAAAVWRDRGKAKAVLQHLRNRRNDLVHHGRESTDPQEVVYILKPYVDELLGRLIGNARHFSSLTEFGEYLDLLRDQASLDRKSALVRLAKRAR